MKKLLLFVMTTAMLCSMPSFVFAGTAKSPDIQVSVPVPGATLSIALGVDESCTGSPTQILFTQDTTYPSFMIAPNRADMDAEKNWHFVQITANKKWMLEVQGTDLTGPATISINKLRYWYSGTYAGYSQILTNPKSTADDTNDWEGNEIALSPAWELVYTSDYSVIGAKSYMQYQLDIGDAPVSGNYTGKITYQVTDSMV